MCADTWKRRMDEKFGKEPEVTYYETPVTVHISNEAKSAKIG
jgi:hypothetical protein